MITEDAVRETLKQVYDPEIPINVVDMGLIYSVAVTGDDVAIDMTLTGRGCPMHGLISDLVRRKVAEIPGVATVQVNVVWDPPWNPSMMSREVQIRYGFATADEGTTSAS
jgi:metal-sulfur cluster biosynthetic enzyme